jgi:uncharacterized protein
MKSTLKGYALVTGGGSGLGLEIAKQLGGREFSLIICGRRMEPMEKAAELCRSCGAPEVKIVSVDLSRDGEGARLLTEVSSICKTGGRGLEIVVNNAGRGLFGPVTEQEPRDLSSMLRLNVESLALLCRLFLPLIGDHGSGKILNVGSVAGGQPMPFFAAYGASKAFVHHFSLALRAELAGSGVSLTLLEPGFIRTGFDEAAGIGSETYRSFSFRNGMSGEAVAKPAIKALLAGKAKVMPGFGNRASSFLGSFLPHTLIASIMKRSVLGLTGKKSKVKQNEE